MKKNDDNGKSTANGDANTFESFFRNIGRISAEFLCTPVIIDDVAFVHGKNINDTIINDKKITISEAFLSKFDLEHKLQEMIEKLNKIIDICLPQDRYSPLNEFVRLYPNDYNNVPEWNDLISCAINGLPKRDREKAMQAFLKNTAIAIRASANMFILNYMNETFKELPFDFVAAQCLNIGEECGMLCLALHEDNAIKGNNIHIHSGKGGDIKTRKHKPEIKSRRKAATKYVQDHPNNSMAQAKENLAKDFGVSTKTIDRNCNDILQRLNQKK